MVHSRDPVCAFSIGMSVLLSACTFCMITNARVELVTGVLLSTLGDLECSLLQSGYSWCWLLSWRGIETQDLAFILTVDSPKICWKPGGRKQLFSGEDQKGREEKIGKLAELNFRTRVLQNSAECLLIFVISPPGLRSFAVCILYHLISLNSSSMEHRTLW